MRKTKTKLVETGVAEIRNSFLLLESLSIPFVYCFFVQHFSLVALLLSLVVVLLLLLFGWYLHRVWHVVFDIGWCKSYGFLIFHLDPFLPNSRFLLIRSILVWFRFFAHSPSLFFLFFSLFPSFSRVKSHRITIHLSSIRIICNILLIFVFCPTHSLSLSLSLVYFFVSLPWILRTCYMCACGYSWNSVRWTDKEKKTKFNMGHFIWWKHFEETHTHKNVCCWMCEKAFPLCATTIYIYRSSGVYFECLFHEVLVVCMP